MRRARGWTAPASIAVIIAGLVVVLSWLLLQRPVTECLPNMQVSGTCEPLATAKLVPFLAIEGGVVFGLVFAFAYLVRAAARLLMRALRSLRHDATSAGEVKASVIPAAGSPRPLGTSRRARRAGAVLLVLTVFLTGIGVDRVVLDAQPADAAAFALIRQAWDLLHTRYVRAAGLDSGSLAHAAIDAMTAAVGDTDHTTFLTPEEAAEETDALAGNYVGVGIELDESGAVPVVSAVYADGPADRAGLRSGDQIVDVDGASTLGMDDAGLMQALSGPADSEVVLTLERGGADQPIVVNVTRGIVNVPAVDWVPVPGTGVALLRIDIFSTGTADQLARALAEIDFSGASKIVLDLRGNPGGDFNEGVWVTSEFLASGFVVQGRDAAGVVRVAPVDRPVVDATGPLVVLVDSDTASAAETVASALQDAGRAKLVGETTFGTGTILGEFRLADGSVLEIGELEWLTRAGRSVWHTGIAPNVVVQLPSGASPLTIAELRSLPPSGLASARDTQLVEAVALLQGLAP